MGPVVRACSVEDTCRAEAADRSGARAGCCAPGARGPTNRSRRRMRAAGCPAGADRKRSSAERGVLGGCSGRRQGRIWDDLTAKPDPLPAREKRPAETVRNRCPYPEFPSRRRQAEKGDGAMLRRAVRNVPSRRRIDKGGGGISGETTGRLCRFG